MDNKDDLKEDSEIFDEKSNTEKEENDVRKIINGYFDKIGDEVKKLIENNKELFDFCYADYIKYCEEKSQAAVSYELHCLLLIIDIVEEEVKRKAIPSLQKNYIIDETGGILS